MSDDQTGNSNLISRPQPWLDPHRFKPGQSGNPKGRPRKVTDAVEKYLKKKHYTGKKNLERLAEAAVERAIAKSDPTLKEIWDRVEGPVVQQQANNVVIVMSGEEMQKAASILDRMRVIDVPVLESDDDELAHG